MRWARREVGLRGMSTSAAAVASPAELEKLRRLLCGLQDTVLKALVNARRRRPTALARVAAHTAADTIYAIDRVTEAAIVAWFSVHWPRAQPVELVMEGLEDEGVRFPRETAAAAVRWVCILDPIDGTRAIMYDKRSAWSLAGLAPRPRSGRPARLDEIVVAAMTELPVTKQTQADQFSAVRGAGLVSTRLDLVTGRRKRWTPRPSTERDFAHGFASVVKFFPAGKARTAALEEALWEAVLGDTRGAGELVFDDQYLSTGGQLHELLVGHDRMVADLRPRVLRAVGKESALTCHPYDLCTALLLTEAGGVVEAPEGGQVREPLDTTTPVAWVGYANEALARKVRPVLRRLLAELAGAVRPAPK